MKKLIVAALMVFPLLSFAQNSTGEVVGTVVLKKDKSPAVGAKVYTKINDAMYGARTELDGRFRISAIPPGKHLFFIVYEGDTLPNQMITVPMDDIATFGTIVFDNNVQVLTEAWVKPKEFESLTYGVKPEIKMTTEQIKQSPQKFDQKAMIASMSSDIRLTDDGELVFRGARKGDMIYVMDGIKMNIVSNVPSASIGSMMAYTGGIPAKYGDTTGGVVVMESLSYFDLYRAWYARQLKEGTAE